TDPTERSLLPQLVLLGDTVERFYKDVAYLGLPNGRDSEIRAKFVVPYEGLPNNPRVVIRVRLFGRTTGTMTDLDTNYKRVTRPTQGAPTALVAGNPSVTLTTNIAVNAVDVHELESEPISVAAGDLLYVSLLRSA